MRRSTTTRVRIPRFPLARTALSALLLAALAAAPAAANIVQGSDAWVTQPGTSHQDFNPTPIPPGFFAPGSQPFDGIVYFQGLPLGGGFGPTIDTIVERQAFAPLPGCGSEFTVPIEIVALSLVSVNPITVTNDVGPPTQWNVRVTLSSIAPQPPGTMTIRKTHANGGTFSSTLYVQPKFIFTQVGNPVNQRILDTGGLLPPVQLGSSSHWLDPAAAPQFSFDAILAPTPLDHDLNPGTPDRIITPSSPNFQAGMRGVGGSCSSPPDGAGKVLTWEEQQWAAHGVLPPQEGPPQPDNREGSTCLPDGTCIITTPTIAQHLGGTYRGDDTYCAGDANGDGRDDNCALNVPGLPPAGSTGLALLLAIAGLWFVARRRERSRAA